MLIYREYTLLAKTASQIYFLKESNSLLVLKVFYVLHAATKVRINHLPIHDIIEFIHGPTW